MRRGRVGHGLRLVSMLRKLGTVGTVLSTSRLEFGRMFRRGELVAGEAAEVGAELALLEDDASRELALLLVVLVVEQNDSRDGACLVQEVVRYL